MPRIEQIRVELDRRLAEIAENGELERRNGGDPADVGLKEAKIIIEAWRRHYNTVRLHSSLGYRPPAPELYGGLRNPDQLRRPARA
jgi:transposase InsO family protein